MTKLVSHDIAKFKIYDQKEALPIAKHKAEILAEVYDQKIR